MASDRKGFPMNTDEIIGGGRVVPISDVVKKSDFIQPSFPIHR